MGIIDKVGLGNGSGKKRSSSSAEADASEEEHAALLGSQQSIHKTPSKTSLISRSSNVKTGQMSTAQVWGSCVEWHQPPVFAWVSVYTPATLTAASGGHDLQCMHICCGERIAVYWVL